MGPTLDVFGPLDEAQRKGRKKMGTTTWRRDNFKREFHAPRLGGWWGGEGVPKVSNIVERVPEESRHVCMYVCVYSLLILLSCFVVSWHVIRQPFHNEAEAEAEGRRFLKVKSLRPIRDCVVGGRMCRTRVSGSGDGATHTHTHTHTHTCVMCVWDWESMR